MWPYLKRQLCETLALTWHMAGLNKYPFFWNRNTHQGRIPQGNGNYLPADRAKPFVS